MLFAALPELAIDAFLVFGGTASLAATWVAISNRFEKSVGTIVEVKLDEKLEKVTDRIIDQFRSEIRLTEERFDTQLKQINVEILNLRARVVALENVNSKKEKK